MLDGRDERGSMVDGIEAVAGVEDKRFSLWPFLDKLLQVSLEKQNKGRKRSVVIWSVC